MDLKQKVQSTGEVVPESRVDLRFEAEGRIEEVKKEEGDEVLSGETIVQLESTKAVIGLDEALANLKNAQASLDKTLSGPTEEEIDVYERAVDSAEESLDEAQTALDNARQSLEDTRREEEEDVLSAYEDGLSELRSAELKAENAFREAKDVQRDYFFGSDQESLRVKSASDIMERRKDELEELVEEASTEDKNGLKQALDSAEEKLGAIYEELRVVRDLCDDANYRNTVSSTDKTALDNQKSYISTAESSIVDAPVPEHHEKYLQEDTFTYPVAFNGKMRFKLELPVDIDQEKAKEIVLNHEKAQKWLNEKPPKKVIFVPNKIINVVV